MDGQYTAPHYGIDNHEKSSDVKSTVLYYPPPPDDDLPSLARSESANAKQPFYIKVTSEDDTDRYPRHGSVSSLPPPPPYPLTPVDGYQSQQFPLDVKYEYQGQKPQQQQGPTEELYKFSAYPTEKIYQPAPLPYSQQAPHRASLSSAQTPSLYPASSHGSTGQQSYFETQEPPQAVAQGYPLTHYQSYPAQYNEPPPAAVSPLQAPPPMHNRRASAPAVPVPNWQTQPCSTPAVAAQTMPPAVAYVPPPGPVAASDKHVDDRTSNLASRFVGNMLVVRLARSGVQSVASTAKLPFYLSPWGDNNPITLPNVRKRDIALAGVAHFGVDALAPAAITLVDTCVQHAVTFTAERVADSSLHKMQGHKAHKVMRRVGVNSLEIRIKHKLIGEDASILLFQEKEAPDMTCCAKGWYCPYLYASGRTPQLARGKDFSIAQFIGPGLVADASLAPILLSSITHPQQSTDPNAAPSTPLPSTSILTTACPSISPHPTFPKFRRMAFFLLGISPYRTATAWSQSRIPSEARLQFHLFSQIPALVVPVKRDCPVLGWSPWTLGQMLRCFGATGAAAQGSAQGQPSAYSLERQYYELLNWIESLIDVELMDDAEMKQGGWRNTVGAAVGQMVQAVRETPETFWQGVSVKGVVDLDRAGIVGLRF